MLSANGRRLLWGKSSAFADLYCLNCQAGWTRTGPEGGSLTVCLLDREPVLADMTSCDRYEAREEPEVVLAVEEPPPPLPSAMNGQLCLISIARSLTQPDATPAPVPKSPPPSAQ